MRVRRLGAAVPWVITIGGGVGALVAWPGHPVRLGGRWRVAAQSLAPWAALATAPIAVLAMTRRRWRLAATAASVAGVGAVMVRDGAGAATLTDRHPDLRVAHANLLFANEEMAAVAEVLIGLDADVMGFNEYTDEHATTLRASALGDRYPHRLERIAPGASGAALWSRRPLLEVPAPRMVHETCAADVTLVDGRTVRVLTVHTISPIHHFDEWSRDLGVLADPTWRPTTATVMVGDLNAAWTHPELRSVVANGWRTAHRQLGRGMVGSWRVDGRHLAFVRIDHALLSDELEATGVVEVDIPGSDHRGFVVSVAMR